MRNVNVVVRYCNGWPEGSADAALRHRFLFGLRGESLGCVDGHLPSKFGHEAACADGCAGTSSFKTRLGHPGVRIINAHLYMCDGTINLSRT